MYKEGVIRHKMRPTQTLEKAVCAARANPNRRPFQRSRRYDNKGRTIIKNLLISSWIIIT